MAIPTIISVPQQLSKKNAGKRSVEYIFVFTDEDYEYAKSMQIKQKYNNKIRQYVDEHSDLSLPDKITDLII